MDWVALVVGIVVAAVVVGLMLERRRRALRLRGPEHGDDHRPAAPDRQVPGHGEATPTDHRLGGFAGPQ